MQVTAPGPRATYGPRDGPRRHLTRAAVCFGLAVAASISPSAAPQQAPAAAPVGVGVRATLDRYCVTCHNQRLRSGELALDSLDVSNVAPQAATWEKVVRK